VHAHRESKRPLYRVSHPNGFVSQASNFVLHIAERIKTEKWAAPAQAQTEHELVAQ